MSNSTSLSEGEAVASSLANDLTIGRNTNNNDNNTTTCRARASRNTATWPTLPQINLSGSGIDLEALAALPDEMRQESIASLAPDLKAEILLTANQAFLDSLLANILAEAQLVLQQEQQYWHHWIGQPGAASNAPHPHGGGNDDAFPVLAPFSSSVPVLPSSPQLQSSPALHQQQQ